MVELEDIGNFSWQVYIAEDTRNLLHFPENSAFKNCHLIIKYFGDDVNPTPANLTEWVEILERAFYLLNEEDISIYDAKVEIDQGRFSRLSYQEQSNIEVKPGKMNLSWTFKARRYPMNFQVTSVWWEKDFYLKIK